MVQISDLKPGMFIRGHNDTALPVLNYIKYAPASDCYRPLVWGTQFWADAKRAPYADPKLYDTDTGYEVYLYAPLKVWYLLRPPTAFSTAETHWYTSKFVSPVLFILKTLNEWTF
jgi:hypothetical protein